MLSFSGTYLYGLTATPERKNGHEPILFQRIGPILYTASEEQVAFEKQLSLRFTDFGKYDIQDKKSTNFVDLCDKLAQSSSKNDISSVFVMSGQTKAKEKQSILAQIEQLDDAEPFVLISIGKYVGEGVDLQKLDTLVLASPMSWKNNLIQYAGRIHTPLPTFTILDEDIVWFGQLPMLTQ